MATARAEDQQRTASANRLASVKLVALAVLKQCADAESATREFVAANSDAELAELGILSSGSAEMAEKESAEHLAPGPAASCSHRCSDIVAPSSHVRVIPIVFSPPSSDRWCAPVPVPHA